MTKKMLDTPPIHGTDALALFIHPHNNITGVVSRALQAVRTHLGMEVAYVSEIVGDQSVFREVDAPGQEALIKPGDSHALDDVYCRHILEGRLPGIMADTAKYDLAMALPITAAVPIGAHLSVPITLPDGRHYGMFCCLGFKADTTLNKRDLQMMKAFAELTAYEIDRNLTVETLVSEKSSRVREVIDTDTLSIAFQPIWNITGRHQYPVGVECLARFPGTPRSPDLWFREAAEVGLGVELELAAIRKALSYLYLFPDPAYFALNVSADTILSKGFVDIFVNQPLKRIVLEITEHASVADYDAVAAVIEPLKRRGLRLAADDAGSGFAGLHHILELCPNLIKLDKSLIRDIHRDPARQALVSALVGFARKTNSEIIAEGVESAKELTALRLLGAGLAQGYLLGYPASLDDAVALFEVKQRIRLQVA